MANNTVISLVLRAKDEASNVLTGTFAKLTAIFAAFAGFTGIKNALEDLTELDKVTQRLSLSTEEFMAGQYAAMKLAGVSADEYADSLAEVRIKLEEWSSIQAGGATDFFEIMNVDVKDFMKLNPQEQLLKIAETMKDMSASAQFTFLDQMGSDAMRNLLPALKDGGAEFRKMLEQAKQYNLVISSFDAKAVRSLNTEFQTLGQIADSTFKKAFANIAPELQALVEIVKEQMLGMSEGAQAPLNSIGEKFRSVINGMIDGVDFLAKLKDSFDIAFHGMKSVVLLFAEVFVTGMQTIETGTNEVMNATEKVLRKAFAGFVQLINNAFIKPISSALKLVGAGDLSNQLNQISDAANNYAIALNKKGPAFEARNLQPTINKLRELREESNNLVKENINLVVNGTFDAESLKKDYNEKVTSIENDLAIKVKTEEQEKKRDIAKGGDAKFNAANAAAAAAQAASQVKLLADLAKAEIEAKIKNIENKRDLDLAGLEQRARDEGLSANKIADMRLKLELDSAREISTQRKKLIDEDIKSLEAQIAAQGKILAVELNDGARGGALTSIKDLEAEITRKRMEQKQIGADLVAQSAILKANRAAELGNLKAQLEQIKEEAELELRVIRGDSVGVELEKLDKQWKDTVRDMEEVGVDSTAVKDLLSAKKAEIELNDIESQFAALKKKLETNKISPFEYLKEVVELEKKGTEKTTEVGNPERADKFAEAAKEAKAEVFELESIMEKVGDSMTSGFENAFSELISGSKSAKEAFSDMAQSVLMDIGKIIAKLVIQLAYQSMISALSGGSSSAAGAGSGGGLMSSLSGLIGSLPKFHTGGIIGQGADNYGLSPDEALIVAKKGEEMITEKDPRHRKNAGSGNGNGESPNITIINNLDNDAIAHSVFEHPSYETKFLNTLRSNAEVVRSL
ncbi:phage tail tape measure protein [Pseudomonas benzenivorans]|uniref:Phage tail tape measure protein n=1 Tax=Pseudomonas benzenivorans TaxID=556533 RepID=A0ABZ0PRD3_9PSED|nr:phage tail tape measure protein [Pseudomonas benzenivorans]WPC03460.1 phage tail tape measure protein [Pseudomonas benzenivorans]